MTDALQLLHDNYIADNGSFLYYLHEEDHFDEKAFDALLGCVSALCDARPEDQTVPAQINFVYGQVLRHILYHFDPNDASQIVDLPADFYERLELLEGAVIRYFRTKFDAPA